MATIEIWSKDTTSVSLYLDNLTTAWEQGTRTVIWYIAKGYAPSATNFDIWTPGEDIENKASSGGLGTFSGLEPDTQYYVFCEVYHGSNLLSEIGGEDDPWWFVTDEEGGDWEEPDQPLDVEKWDWSANTERAQAWRSLIVPSVYPIKENFSHNVWNDLVAKVNELIGATDLGWIGDYGSYEDTKMTFEPYELTADKFNSLRNNLDFVCINRGIDRTGIGRVYSLDKNYPVLASYFSTIANFINRCIDGY